MNAILSFFKLTPEALAKWIATGIGALAGKWITTLDPSLAGPVGGLITALSAVIAGFVANLLHFAPSPNVSAPAPVAPADPAK